MKKYSKFRELYARTLKKRREEALEILHSNLKKEQEEREKHLEFWNDPCWQEPVDAEG